MGNIEVKFKKLVDWAKIPEYETRGAAGCDLAIAIQEEIVLYPNEVRSLPSGLAMMIPPGYEAQIRSRAGMAGKGIVVANAPATIDSDHNGEVKILLLNVTDKPVRVLPGQKVAQMVFAPVVQASFTNDI
ncbi:MAG: dUTP diphosphatase [Syntrophomonas sp.]|uniref:dUTP diphosphatase n=1 Tax=Syntrophomonas sp. TaxID=2053627 RepID=UPI00261B29CD|nr:dUTP diphosphatase [Syntrophomonas sp.]MDD2510999.1 dUTP diphosphatase [Syntrophomonas sp.]MDD3878929.1 dUTP diphosphatase [Syntrophomonas sp.]MDD4626613.1 dUTP diphosphatase [Syntrophomonas sp.]